MRASGEPRGPFLFMGYGGLTMRAIIGLVGAVLAGTIPTTGWAQKVAIIALQMDFLSADVALLRINASGLPWLSAGGLRRPQAGGGARPGLPPRRTETRHNPCGGHRAGGAEASFGGSYLQLNASTYDKGHSGGPVINIRGEVVGIAKGTATIREIVPSHLLGLWPAEFVLAQ